MRFWRRSGVAIVTVVVAAACGGGGSSGSNDGTVTTTVTQTVTAGGGSTGGGAATLPCAASDFLPGLKATMDDAAENLTIVRVKVTRCQNDYALVLAVPDNSGCQQGGSCFDSAQVILHWNAAKWNILDSGTDIGCTSIPLSTDRLAACKALGYPILTGTAFKMPSRNIGCALGGGLLRCDIRSGLAPQPSASCEGDWGGVTLAAHGPAKPLCASDTVYDDSAPTLDYGSVWGGGGVTCLSAESGLQCSSAPGRHTFFLSRQSWSAS
jgi:hypothetical protein